MAQERHTAAFVVGIALGGLAGAGYVLFTTPRSGAEVRAGIAARVRGIVGAVKETAGVVGVETRRAGEQTVERIEATGAAVRDRLPGASGVSDLDPGPRRDTPIAAPIPAPAEPPGAVPGPAGGDDGVGVSVPVAAAPVPPVAGASNPSRPTLAPDGVPARAPRGDITPPPVGVAAAHPVPDLPLRSGE